MDYLFSLNKRGTYVFHLDAVKLCPELSILDDNEILFLILAYSYKSPFYQMRLPEQDRVNKAMQQVFGGTNKDVMNKGIIQNAAEAIKALQYDPKMELLRIYEDKLNMLSEELKHADSSKNIQDILKSQTHLKDAAKNLEDDIMNNLEIQETLKGGGTLSFIERLIKNKEEYDRVVSKKTIYKQAE